MIDQQVYALYDRVNEQPPHMGISGYLLIVSRAPAWKIVRGRLHYRWATCRPLNPLQKALGVLSERIRYRPFLPDGVLSEADNNTPWEIRQDTRCYAWNDHPVVVAIPIDEQTYLLLGGESISGSERL